jgi:hypothetical protein
VTEPPSSRWTATVVTTTLAALLNLLIAWGLYFDLLPKVRQGADESRANREAVLENRRLIGQVAKDLDEAHRVAVRIDKLLDEAERRAKAREKEKDGNGKDKERP